MSRSRAVLRAGRGTARPTAVFLWRKLDQPGHDCCGLWRVPGGWRLSGAAAFREGRRACHLRYDVAVDGKWRTRRAIVRGHVGRRAVDLRIAPAGGGRWRLDGALVPGIGGCVDVDLGFTPATNLIAIRRLALRTGEQADAPAAYVQFPALRLVMLPQTYRRLARTRYAYASPTVGYAGTLEVSSLGAVIHYPGLFDLVPAR